MYHNNGRKGKGRGQPSPRIQVRRMPKRGAYDRETIRRILDEALVCHVGFASEGQPFVIPTTYARVGDELYLHGSAASRMLRGLAGGVPVCVTVTLLDGLVMARSAFHHSMNYRSVVVLGVAVEVSDPGEKRAALDAIVEHVAPGRAREARPPTPAEMAATLVVKVPLNEASAKVRTGPPVDDEEDYGLDCWAGEVPLRLVAFPPVSDPRLPPRIAPPQWALSYRRVGADSDGPDPNAG